MGCSNSKASQEKKAKSTKTDTNKGKSKSNSPNRKNTISPDNNTNNTNNINSNNNIHNAVDGVTRSPSHKENPVPPTGTEEAIDTAAQGAHTIADEIAERACSMADQVAGNNKEEVEVPDLSARGKKALSAAPSHSPEPANATAAATAAGNQLLIHQQRTITTYNKNGEPTTTVDVVTDVNAMMEPGTDMPPLEDIPEGNHDDYRGGEELSPNKKRLQMKDVYWWWSSVSPQRPERSKSSGIKINEKGEPDLGATTSGAPEVKSTWKAKAPSWTQLGQLGFSSLSSVFNNNIRREQYAKEEVTTPKETDPALADDGWDVFTSEGKPFGEDDAKPEFVYE